MKNKYAQFQREIGVEKVFSERLKVNKPLGLDDLAPISDGAAALILANPEIVEKRVDKSVCIVGSSSATDFISFPSRDDRTGFISSRIAMKNALKMANIGIPDIRLVELYDQSTLLEMIALEDLGFSEKGKA